MEKRKLSGRKSLFRRKVRAPVSLTLTPAHHAKVRANRDRLGGISRSDFVGLLIDQFADVVTLTRPPAVDTRAYRRLRDVVAALGGRLEHRKRGEPRGGTWVLTLGPHQLKVPSEQAMRFPALDACYRLKPGVTVSQTWKDHLDEIDLVGIAALFSRVSQS